MLQDMKGRKIVGFLQTKRTAEFAAPQLKFSNEDWDLNNQQKLQMSRYQTQLAQRINKESERVIDEVNEKNKAWQREVNHQIGERTIEIGYLTDELDKQKKNASLEDETLSHYRNRILKALEQIDNALKINHECLKLRAGRIGADLCVDDIEVQLKNELATIKGCGDMMRKAYHDSTQQLQRLRSAIFLLDKDIEQKNTALRIDRKNLILKDTMYSLGGGGKFTQPECTYTFDEWQRITSDNIDSNAKELNSASQLRGYVDLLLRQVGQDLQNQTERTNEAFRNRIRETREIKHLLETKHAESTIETIRLNDNIEKLQQEIANTQRSLELCQVRLTNRGLRPNLELTCDVPQKALYDEWKQLQCSLAKLNQKLTQNKSMLRYMNHTQLIQEEEINIKANTLKIDEVDCQSLRQVLMYPNF